MKCLTNECIVEYRDKLEKSIADYMKMPASQRSAEAVKSMYEALDIINSKIKDNSIITPEEMTKWVNEMQNADGTTGAHWTVEETSGVGVPDGISALCWNTVMNMMYSDYFDVADRYGVNTPEFYAEMAKAFLFDKDAKQGKEKLSAYYRGIV